MKNPTKTHRGTTSNKYVVRKSSILSTLLILLLSIGSLMAQVVYEQPLAGSEEGIGFLLTWSTYSEANNQYFVVERSQDGAKFETLGTVTSKIAEDKETNYQFKDFELGLKNVAYRLKQVSSDGSNSYSEVITLKKQFINYFEVVNKKKISEEVFQVSVNSIKEGELECRLINNMGELLIEELKPLKVGVNDYVFDLTSEIDGTYHLVFKQKNVLETVVFNKETKDRKSNVAKKRNKSDGG